MKAISVETMIADQVWRITNLNTENDVKNFIKEINDALPIDNS